MKKTFYLLNPGRLSRKDNTLKFTPVDSAGQTGQPKYLPVENVSNLYAFGSLDANSAMYNFLGKAGISIHFFDYYEHYTGSFMPKEYLLAGKMQIEQVRHYIDHAKRMVLAKTLVEGAIANMLRNLNYHKNRGKEALATQISKIEKYHQGIEQDTEHELSVAELMGIEGNARKTYYQAFDEIINDFKMQGRSKRPPQNEVNALVSFVNQLCYTLCLDQIYHTQLNPTVSFLHEPGHRRYSLALDVSEIFKPLLVDRLIFKLFNYRQIQAKHFDKKLNACHLKESGKRIVLREWDEKLKQSFKHKDLGKPVKYKQLVKLECYKIAKHVLGVDEYMPFRARW